LKKNKLSVKTRNPFLEVKEYRIINYELSIIKERRGVKQTVSKYKDYHSFCKAEQYK
jgi:hypothetical protein